MVEDKNVLATIGYLSSNQIQLHLLRSQSSFKCLYLASLVTHAPAVWRVCQEACPLKTSGLSCCHWPNQHRFVPFYHQTRKCGYLFIKWVSYFRQDPSSLLSLSPILFDLVKNILLKMVCCLWHSMTCSQNCCSHSHIAVTNVTNVCLYKQCLLGTKRKTVTGLCSF